MTAPTLSRRALLAATALAPMASLPALAAPGDRIRKIVLVGAAQASDPQEFQAAQLLAAGWRQLGLEIEVRGLPRPQLSALVWNSRDKWDMAMWRMVGRPERSDPDELTYNLFNPSTAEAGYNFVNWISPEYMKVAEAQRGAMDRNERQALLHQAQDMVSAAQPYILLVYPKNVFAFDANVLKSDTVVEQPGIGVRSFWTFLRAEPAGAQRDVICNAAEALVACNPLYISGAIDSWVTELIWDRLMRVGPDGLPQPWAAESVTQVDPLTVDCVIRAGQAWHDGKPLTADDVVFSFEAPATGDKSPMYKPFVANVAKVEATGDRTVRFTLRAPSAAFETTTLAKINLVPRHVWGPILADLANKPQNAETVQAPPIGSGPWKAVSVKLQEEIVLEANGAHWERPRMDRWILRVVTNTDAALGMLPRGEINFLSDYRGDPKLLTDLAAKNPNVRVVSTVDMGFRFAAPNGRRPPFDDPAFRRALSMTANRPMMAQAAWNGFAVPANSTISPALPFWHKPGIDDVKPDLAGARKLLADAGYQLVGGKLHYPEGKKETLAPN